MNVKPRIGTHRAQRESAAIFRLYAAKLQAIAALDRAYYANLAPSRMEFAEYHQRKAVLERVRLRLYAELGRVSRARWSFAKEPAELIPVDVFSC